MATEEDFSWEDDLMTKSFQKQESHLAKLSKIHGKNYGKPVAGSESERRSQEYQKNVIDEVASLCFQISLHGYKASDGTEQILFGDLFKLNEKISNKCVGLLQRARKYRFDFNLGSSETNPDQDTSRLLHFAGETLWQGADDKVVISLLRRNRCSLTISGHQNDLWIFREIQVYFTHTKRLLPNSPSGNLWIDIDSSKRVHFDWVTNVREVSPFKLAYHVLVHEADEEDLQNPCHQSLPIPDLNKPATAHDYQEPQVIFKLLSITVTKVIILGFPKSLTTEELYGEASSFMRQTNCCFEANLGLECPSLSVAINIFYQVHIQATTFDCSPVHDEVASCRTADNCFVTATNGETIKISECEKKRKEPAVDVYIRPVRTAERKERPVSFAGTSSCPVRPKIKLNLEPPPPLPTMQRVKKELPEMPRLQIKFSTCTALYKPAQPIYENWKKTKDNFHKDRKNYNIEK